MTENIFLRNGFFSASLQSADITTLEMYIVYSVQYNPKILARKGLFHNQVLPGQSGERQ